MTKCQKAACHKGGQHEGWGHPMNMVFFGPHPASGNCVVEAGTHVLFEESRLYVCLCPSKASKAFRHEALRLRDDSAAMPIDSNPEHRTALRLWQLEDVENIT